MNKTSPMETDHHIAVLILAAGASRRFGSPKQLLHIGGKNLLQRCIDSANALLPGSVFVVLGHQHQRIKKSVRYARFIVNHDWEEGIGSSIAFGIRHLKKDYSAVLILLADQPDISINKLKLMLEKSCCGKIVCAFYKGTRGVPAVFPARYFNALSELKGDNGAKKILRLSGQSVIEVPIKQAAFDIDSTSDFLAIGVKESIQDQ